MSTVQREPLPANAATIRGYITDEAGLLRSQGTAESGMINFYNKTGVAPYLYITDSINGIKYPSGSEAEAFMSELYDELFTDEAHILVLFVNPDPNTFYRWYLCGAQAKQVIDNEAANILLDYFDSLYYDENLSNDQYFSQVFDKTAERIMTVTKSPWPVVLIVLIVVVAIIIVIAVSFNWWKKAKAQKNLEAEQTERILNTPLETFGDKNMDDLKKKYDDK